MSLDASDLGLVLERLTPHQSQPGAEMLRNAPSCIWLGSGLAKISAFHGAALVGRLCGKPSRAMTPLEYCQTPKARCLPVLLTLRGRNADATGLASAIVSRRAPRAVVLTGDSCGQAASMLQASNVETAVAETPLPAEDRRFVNCKAIFTLSALASRLARASLEHKVPVCARRLTEAFTRASDKSETLARQIEAAEEWQKCQFFILSDGAPSDLSVTWASVFAESGIVNATCVDLKDFTHGDHLAVSLRGRGIFIVLRHTGIASLCDIFSRRFSSLFPVVEINLQTGGAETFWENLFYACNVTSRLSLSLGYQGGRPPKHPVVWGWRGWGEIDQKP
jgi:hypothetical protein